MADAAAAEMMTTGVLSHWLGPLAEAGEALTEEMGEEEFKRELARLASGEALGDSKGIEGVLVREIVTGMQGEDQ